MGPINSESFFTVYIYLNFAAPTKKIELTEDNTKTMATNKIPDNGPCHLRSFFTVLIFSLLPL